MNYVRHFSSLSADQMEDFRFFLEKTGAGEKAEVKWFLNGVMFTFGNPVEMKAFDRAFADWLKGERV